MFFLKKQWVHWNQWSIQNKWNHWDGLNLKRLRNFKVIAKYQCVTIGPFYFEQNKRQRWISKGLEFQYWFWLKWGISQSIHTWLSLHLNWGIRSLLKTFPGYFRSRFLLWEDARFLIWHEHRALVIRLFRWWKWRILQVFWRAHLWKHFLKNFRIIPLQIRLR